MQELENELSLAKAALTAASSRLLANCREGVADDALLTVVKSSIPGTNYALPRSEMSRDEAVEENMPGILLQSLPLHDVLRTKWKLGAGLPSGGFDCKCRQGGGHVVTTGGGLRIFGLLEDGSPWEHIIPFCELAAEGGVLLGRDPQASRIVLEDESVSRAHARIEIAPQGVVVSDVGSTNGLKVNNNEVSLFNSPVPIADGSVLTLGEVPLQVEFLPA